MNRYGMFIIQTSHYLQACTKNLPTWKDLYAQRPPPAKVMLSQRNNEFDTMNRYRICVVQTLTLLPSMHRKLTKLARYANEPPIRRDYRGPLLGCPSFAYVLAVTKLVDMDCKPKKLNLPLMLPKVLTSEVYFVQADMVQWVLSCQCTTRSQKARRERQRPRL